MHVDGDNQVFPRLLTVLPEINETPRLSDFYGYTTQSVTE